MTNFSKMYFYLFLLFEVPSVYFRVIAKTIDFVFAGINMLWAPFRLIFARVEAGVGGRYSPPRNFEIKYYAQMKLKTAKSNVNLLSTCKSNTL